jgi:hypothetical protein
MMLYIHLNFDMLFDGKKLVMSTVSDFIYANLHNNNNNKFSIPEIHQSGYRTCHYITAGKVQNESLQ